MPTAVRKRDGVRLGLAVHGGDPAADGALIRVSDVHGVRSEFEQTGPRVGDFRAEELDGQHRTVFFVFAPVGLCFQARECRVREPS